jgi:hypothetical protein
MSIPAIKAPVSRVRFMISPLSGIACDERTEPSVRERYEVVEWDA